MELRKKLLRLFLALVTSIFIISSIVIYLWFSEYRKTEFFDRMQKKSQSIAVLLMDVDEIDAHLLMKIEETKPASLPEEKMIIYNKNDQILYSNPQSLSFPKEITDEIKKNVAFQWDNKGLQVIGFNYIGKNDQVFVVISAKDIFGLTKLKKLQFILISVSLLCLVLVYFSGLIFIRKALNPIANLISQVDNITFSNLNERLNEGNKTDELAKLAITFNKMLKRLESAINMQRVFIANASHELKNPLTVITLQLEIALIKDRSNEEYKSSIKSVLNDIINVNEIANRLLLIAQANSDFTGFELIKVRIDDTLWQARQEIKKMFPEYSVDVIFDERLDDENLLSVLGNQLLLKVALINLIENACKYSDDHKVNITVNLLGNNIAMHFIDNGIGINPTDLKLIFEPFYRGKNITGEKGHGIGLSLVKSIIDLHKGKISVNSIVGIETEFIIELPLLNAVYNNNI